MNFNEEEFLELINRLLERLHQADHDHHGSHKIELVYVAPGGQHVDTIQTQNVYTFKQQEPEGQKKQTSPKQLARAIEQCQKFFRPVRLTRCVTAKRSPLNNSKFAAGKRMVPKSLLI